MKLREIVAGVVESVRGAPSEAEREMARLARKAEAFERTRARLDAWAGSSGEEAASLLAEWRSLAASGGRDEYVFLLEREGPKGKVFAVVCRDGAHESRTSHVDAFRLLVECSRPSVADLGSTRDLIWWAAGDADARRILEEIHAAVVAAGTPPAERDAAVLAHVEKLHRAEVERSPVDSIDPEAVRLSAASPLEWAVDRARVVRSFMQIATPLAPDSPSVPGAYSPGTDFEKKEK